VVSDRFSPDITSDKAGAIILPPGGHRPEVDVRIAAVDQRMKRWYKATFQRFHTIYRSEENARVELCLEQGYVLLDSPKPDPWYRGDVFGFRHVEVDSVEASLIHVPPSCVDVWAFSTYVVDPTCYLRWLTDKAKRMGAKFQERKISSFDELSSYDIIINCSGLGSCNLVDDKLLHPVRGQSVSVHSPWLKHWFTFHSADSVIFILPRPQHVVLGSTGEPGNWDETPDPQTTQEIVDNCQRYFPALRKADVVDSWAGLRPLRDPIRLDSCEGPAGSLLVHCYGHGGQGVIFSWGCAIDIGNIVQRRVTTPLKSSL
jgi:glycine/D-amino acid oxidase-like deaminating enzyme